MSNLATSPPPLAFAYRDGELWRLRELAGRHIARTVPWPSFWGILFSMIFIIGLAVLSAQKAGLVTRTELPAVLFTGYLAFASGVGLILLLSRIYRRRLAQTTSAASGRDDVTWEITFSEAGIICQNTLFETRVGWRFVKSIESLPEAVLIILEDTSTLAIPSRIFPDAAARKLFVAALRACVDQADKKR